MRFTAHSLGSILPALILTALVVAATHSASAQSRVDIPFSFFAAGQHCPAGTYTVVEKNSGSVVQLQGAGRSFRWLLGSGDAAPTDTRVMVTFERTGARYALRSVQYRALSTARLDLKEHIIAPADQIALLAH